VKCQIWNLALQGAETWTLGKEEQKCRESFEMLCWIRMEKIIWAGRVRNEETLLGVKVKGNSVPLQARGAQRVPGS